MREQLDKIIEQASGEKYQLLKNQYSALKTIEKDLARQVNNEIRKQSKGFFDITDIFTGEDLIVGALTANPTLVGKGLAGRGIKEVIKYLNNPNRYIKKAFDMLENPPADIRGAIQQANEYLSKRVGLTIKNISKLPPEEQTLRGFNKGTVPQTVDNSLIQEAKNFERAKNLTPEYRDIETKAFDKIQLKENEILSKYTKENGNYINADDLRKEFVDVGYNGQNAAAVQEPVSYLSKQLFANNLKNKGKYATYSSGMSGAGKTTALKNIPQYGTIVKKSAVVLDSNLSNLDSTLKKFAQAEKAGKENVVFYVYRDLEDGFVNGVVKRIRDNQAEMGRIVPTKIIAENAPGSLNVAQELQKRGYKVYVVDNSLGKNKAKLSSFDEILKKVNYSGDLKSKLNNKVKELYERGDITQEQYKAYTK